MGNEHSTNSKKSKSSTKYSNATINNYSTYNPEINSNSKVPENENNNFILHLRKYFKSPSTEKLLFGANSKLKEIAHKLSKISRNERMLKISEELMSQIPQTLSHFVNVDLITSSFGLKSIEHNEFYKAKPIMANKGISIGENLIQDQSLNSLMEKTQFDFNYEKNMSSAGDYHNSTNTNVNFNVNEPSYIKEVMDTSSSFIQILEEFEKISSPITIRDKQGNLNNTKSGLTKSKSRNNILEGQAGKYNSNNSNVNYNYNSNSKNQVKSIGLKNNSKILQLNRSKDKINRLVDESALNDKLNVSNDNSILLSNTKKKFQLNDQMSKIKNIKINLSNNKQRSISPDKKVLSKIEPTLIIDMSNRRHSKLIKNDIKDQISETTLRSNFSRVNLSKSPAKEMKTTGNFIKAEHMGLYSPTDSTHSSQFDTQYLYNTNTNTNTNANNESSRISHKLDMSKIKINPKILKNDKTNSNNNSVIDTEIYNTYSQLKRKSIDAALKDNVSGNKNKKKLNSSYLSDDGVNISVNNSIVRDKNKKIEKRETLSDKNNNKDPKQIKNINININELNIINKEQKSNQQNNQSISGNNLGNNDNKGNTINISDSVIEKEKTNNKSNTKIANSFQIVQKENDKDISSTQNKPQAINSKEDYVINSNNSPRGKLSSDTQDKQTHPNNSLASSAIQKLSKLKSLKINLNINQLKKIKNQDINKSISDSTLEIDNSTNQIERNQDAKDFSTNLEKVGSELGESDSNSRGTTPPRINTPKFKKSSNDNSNSNEMNVQSDESDGGNTRSKSKIYQGPEKLTRINNNTFLESDSYLTKINTSKHNHRKSNSFGGYIHSNNTNYANSLMINSSITNIREKSDFNPNINNSKALKDSNDGEKFSFQNDVKENSFLVNLSADHSEGVSNNSNFVKYVKPRVGFKKIAEKNSQDPKIINEVEEINTSNMENKSLLSEHGAQESTNQNPLNENGDKSNTSYKSKILFKKSKLI